MNITPPNRSASRQAPLAGITVIDMTQALAGPYCAMYLGDLGGDVIKIERPNGGDQARGWGPPFLHGESAYFLSCNRNKRSLALDIARPDGQDIIHRLLAEADVFLVNLPRLDSMQRAGLDPQTCLERNPGLIHCAVSGFGHSGPYAGRGGYDVLAQAMSGTMSLTGEPGGGPTRFPTPLADMTAGLYALIGVLTALFVRERSGQGQAIDIALLDSQLAWLTNVAGSYFATGDAPPRLGEMHPSITPYQPFRAQDKYIMVAAGNDRLWQQMVEAMGLEASTGADPRFATNAGRTVHRPELLALLQPVFASRPAATWLAILQETGVPCSPINDVSEALADPQVLARHMIVELEHPLIGVIKSLGCPVNLSHTPLSYRRPPPTLGQHSQEILAELGYGAGAIARLYADRTVQ